MCGICGYLFFDKAKKVDKEILKNMADIIHYRGPDDEGYFIDNNFGMATKRLSIIDLPGGHQPMTNEDETIWITYNGEIYNFLELKEELIKKGHKFKTNCDTEVIIHSYEEYKEDCLHKFNGMFAFCIYDKKENKLFLARDRLGVKPLYYAIFDNIFIFASELKSILKNPYIKKEIDITALSDYLTFDYIPAPKSIFENMKKLSPGCYLIVKDNSLKIKRYWNLIISDEEFIKDENYIHQKIIELLSSSIKLRLIADVPLGVFLSGGIDSSTIVYLMTNISNSEIKTFNIGFEEKTFDESEYAKFIANYLGTTHYEMIVTNNMVLELLPNLINFIDEPIADPSCIPTFFVSKLAKESVKVVLSGEGGDELFAGYENYPGIKVAKLYRSIIPRFINERLIKPLAFKLPTSFSYITFDYKAKKFTSTYDIPLHYANFLWKGGFDEQEKLLLFNNNYYDIIRTNNSFDIIDNHWYRINSNDELNKILYLDLNLYLADDLLTKIDRMSMANSLEAREPYLDYRLVEFAYKIPSWLKLKGLRTKHIFKETMKDKLPSHIINRKKKGFGIPVSFWIKEGKFKNFVLDVLSKENIKKQGLFNYNFIESILNEHFNQIKDNRKFIWALLIFSMWYEKYI